ncbi:hypothetical protein [Dictyobacter alpinus]|uniref:hypothetical protein n=1 Tax=Dictyobacter alpinus TaxID=2014873 RepID=UPI001386967F|nr:hypothetical protein [Dictyobacter alpinus]
MAKFLRKVAFVLSICLFLACTPVAWAKPVSAHVTNVVTTHSSVTPHVTCPPPPRGCW